MHENSRKAANNARVLEVEKGTFTPIVFSTTGGMGREAHNLFKNIAEKDVQQDLLHDVQPSFNFLHKKAVKATKQDRTEILGDDSVHEKKPAS